MPFEIIIWNKILEIHFKSPAEMISLAYCIMRHVFLFWSDLKSNTFCRHFVSTQVRSFQADDKHMPPLLQHHTLKSTFIKLRGLTTIFQVSFFFCWRYFLKAMISSLTIHFKIFNKNIFCFASMNFKSIKIEMQTQNVTPHFKCNYNVSICVIKTDFKSFFER